MSRSWILPIAIAAFAALVVAALGATITNLGPWYDGLAKPDWTPPRAAFPIAWTAIFALAAVAGVIAWSRSPNRKVSDTVIGLFALNGFLNIAWSLLFFRMERPDLAFYELIALWLSILVLIVYCGRIAKLSALLLLPYLAWVTVAGMLNWEVVRLNGVFG